MTAFDKIMQQKTKKKVPPPTKKELVEEEIDEEAKGDAGDKLPSDFWDMKSDSGDLHIVGDDSSSDVAKAITAILGSDDFRTKTELSKHEVRALAVLIEIGDKMQAMRLLKFAENFMALMISHERGSRREVVASFGALEQFGKRDTSDPLSRFRG